MLDEECTSNILLVDRFGILGLLFKEGNGRVRFFTAIRKANSNSTFCESKLVRRDLKIKNPKIPKNTSPTITRCRGEFNNSRKEQTLKITQIEKGIEVVNIPSANSVSKVGGFGGFSFSKEG
jgi:hypothetical protein